MGCRGCGSEPGFFSAVKKAIFDETHQHHSPKPAYRVPSTASNDDPRSTHHRSPTLKVASALWRNGSDPADTPAFDYLVERKAWPPKGFPLPKSVRWVPAVEMRKAGCKQVPNWAAGAIVFRYEDGNGRGTAVAVEALDESGHRRKGEDRWRRTYGSRMHAKFVAELESQGGPDSIDAFKASISERSCANRIVVCEGEVTALAAALTHPGAAALASGGTANLLRTADFAVQAADESGRSVLIEVDGDEPGRKAATAILEEHSSVEISHSPEGMDVADTLAKRVEDALKEHDGDLAGAWREVMAEARCRNAIEERAPQGRAETAQEL